MKEFLGGIQWSPFWISLKTGLLAAFLAFFPGVFLAAKVRKRRPAVKYILDGIFTLPLVLSPAIIGFLMLMLFSPRRLVGGFLLETFDIRIVQTWKGCVIAAAVIAFPLIYRNARRAFEEVDVQYIHAAQILGMNEQTIFWKIIMSAASKEIAAGTVLAFLRAIGEYGVTSMLAGNILGKTRTMALAVGMETLAGNYENVYVWVIISIGIAWLLLLAVNIFTGRGMKTKRWKKWR